MNETVSTLCPWCASPVQARIVGFTGYGGHRPEFEFQHSCDVALTRMTAREVHLRLEERLEASYYEDQRREEAAALRKGVA